MGKRILLFLALTCVSHYGFSSSLSFQIVQHNASLNKVSQSAYVMEDEIMNYFFDNGFIVSNATASISTSADDDKKLWSDGYYEAAEGSFDAFIQIHLYFNGSADNENKVALGLIDTVSWSVTSVRTGKCIEENKRRVVKPMDRDTEANLRDFAFDFAAHIKQVLRNRV